eukprot:CAMPEP_0206557478 /NCGR_PEP_ID=MMETSP0325_2-20121206/19112_1 /ASSEMBLY_ACC=CAM_ASM_000347 /TAXON_ID=2866 /ORGANISM="Crypthecodinium cohnii, Strain Seligo" /LENGTH=71 /DNA_ID=CAMNT_0054058375 /DNA_START=191 /DNA_END=403 /DNA_ORIENTATION=+
MVGGDGIKRMTLSNMSMMHGGKRLIMYNSSSTRQPVDIYPLEALCGRRQAGKFLCFRGAAYIPPATTTTTT